MIDKRVWTLLGLAFAVTLLVAGCGSPSSQPKEGVLRVWSTWGDEPEQLQALFDRYSLTSAMPVEVTMGVKSAKLAKALAGAAPPDVVIMSSNDPIESLHQQGLVEPLGRWIETTGIALDDIYAAPLAQCAALDGTTVCLPWGCDVYALYWNKDLFEAAGLDPERPPQTMEELAEYADKLTIRDEKGKLGQMGFIPDFAQPHTDLYARMFGGFWCDDAGAELTMDSQPMIDAADWQRQFYTEYGATDVKLFTLSFNRYLNSRHPLYGGRRLACQQCHRGAPRKGDKIPDHGFYAAKVAMMVDGEWQVGPDYISHFRPELNYGVAPFPPPAEHPERANTSIVQGAVVMIPSGAPDKKAAANLLAWMMSPEILADAAYANSSLPTSRTAAQDPRFQEMPYSNVFVDLVAHPNARHLVASPMAAELNRALGRVEENWLRNGGDPTELLSQVQVDLAPKVTEARKRPPDP